MNGSVKKDGKKWYYVVDIGKDSSGKRIQKKKRGFVTKKDAQIALNELLSQVNKGVYVNPSDMLFSELIEMWLEQKRHEIEYSTFKTYKQAIDTHILRCFGNKKISKITYQMLISFVNNMYDKAYSKNYVAKQIAVLKMLFEYAIDNEYLAKNPAQKLKKQEAKTEIIVWNEEEMNRFLKVAKDYAYYLAFLLALTCGCRKGEVLGLRWDAIDFENGIMDIKQTLTNDGKELRDKAKNKQSLRRIKLPSKVIEELKIFKEKFDEKERTLKGNFSKNRLVVSSTEGNPVSPRNVTRSMNIIMEKAGVPRITFHSLRHTHATLLMEQGVHMKVVAERLGHSDIRTTMNRYTHVLPTLQTEAAELIGGLIK